MSRSLFSRLHRRFGTRLSGSDRASHALSLLSNLPPPPQTPPETGMLSFAGGIVGAKECRRIGIIGAGFAGLSAAYHLSLRNKEVVVLEAGPRVGGRVQTNSRVAPGRLIEAGAELIGLNHPTWLQLANRFELGLSVITDESQFAGQGLESPIYLRGRTLSVAQASRLHRELELALDRLTVLADRSVRNAYTPWASPQATQLDSMSMQDWIDQQRHLSKDACRALEVEFSNNNGADPSDQSLLFNLAVIKGGGGYKYWDQAEVFRCQRGNDSLAECLRQDIASKKHNRVMTQSRVRAIEIEERGVFVQVNNGHRVQFDAVVLALPPTQWQSIRFTPPLPAHYSITTGVAVKYLSRVRRRFWISHDLAPTSISDEYGMTWEGTDNQMQARGQAIEFSLFAGGSAARVAMKAISADRHYAALLSKVYPTYPAHRLSGSFVSWPQNPLIKCGYSSPRPGEVVNNAPHLMKPYKGLLYFAGEHTCPAFYGYMEGALQSGLRVAHQIP